MANEVLTNPVIQVSGTATVEPNVEVATLCEVKDSQVVTTSLKVAEIFDRQHSHVLRAIKDLDCSDGFRQSNFGFMLKTTQLPNNATRQDPYYLITRDGFTFLVMGFTGKTAAKYKEAYIRAFNEMEAKLRRQQEEERTMRRMRNSNTPTMADLPRMVKERMEQEQPIVESYGQQRVVSSVTLARLMGKRHEYVCESVRRMFKHVLRPTRLYIRQTRSVRRGFGRGYEAEGVVYYITIEGFSVMRTHSTGLTDEVAEQVMAAFREAKGRNRPGQPNGSTLRQTALPRQEPPKAVKAEASAKPEKQVAPSLPKTPADMMSRFMKAMGVMMGIDVNEMSNLIDGGNK